MQLPAAWFREFGSVGVILGLLWLAGAASGFSGYLALAGLLLYFGWHVFNLLRLTHWLERNRKKLPGFTPGIWGYIYDGLETRRRKTARRKKQVRRLLKAFNTSSRALPDATITLDRDFRIQWLNDAAGSLLGMRKSDTGQPVTNLIRHPDFRIYLDNGRFDEPLSLASPVGVDREMMLKIVPYGHKQYLLLARDITRQKRLDQMRRDFIANASHELRTPLAVLQGSIEQMELQCDENDSRCKPLTRMRRQCERMRHILEDLLTLARLEGRLSGVSPMLEVISPAVLLRDLVEEARALSEQHGGHEFRLELDDSFQLRINMEDLLNACSNLVINAVRYTPAGGTITTTLERLDGNARISISDTGVGIPEVHLPRLTERFYRVDAGRSSESGGTGLGLSIVKHALEQYRSKLEIDSQPGKGSTFAFTIPAEFVVEGSPGEHTLANRASVQQ
jgi:two-component system phosphate regulon sensor histidine kinase PhoR